MSEIIEVRVPDIGDFDEVDVVEVLVTAGQEVAVDDSLITLESDKASMEVPATAAGRIEEVKVAVGDKVGEGAVIVTIAVASAPARKEAEPVGGDETKPAAEEEPASEEEPPEEATGARSETSSARRLEPPPSPLRSGPAPSVEEAPEGSVPHASPSVRRFARVLGVDLRRIRGSGAKGRILKADVEAFVKQMLTGGSLAAAGASAAGPLLPPMPAIDFSRFGETVNKPLSRIRRIAARNLHRSWLHVPHVTQHDEADVTEMEAFRKSESVRAKEMGIRLTPLVFIMKGVVAALEQFPDFNSSLHPDGEQLILKRYFHLGIAVDTEDGLVVPVIRDVDKKGLFDLARELAEVSARARDGKLRLDDLQGACFSISSLGGIGGSYFTPIVNAPEVAILGVSRSYWKPVLVAEEFVPRLMLPLSLSYDHRVIDGATAVRFTTFLVHVLSDVRRLLL